MNRRKGYENGGKSGMKKKLKLLCVLLSVTLMSGTFAGCAATTTETTGKTTAATESIKTDSTETAATTTKSELTGAEKYPKFLTVDLFDGLANYQGIATGWFADVVKEKFNMELNIIAPNVAGGGETLYQTRSAAGNLGDLIITGADGGRLQDMVTAGLLLDSTSLFAARTNISKYQSAVDSLNKMVDGDSIYAVPSSVSELSPTTPSEGLDLTFGPYLRWDAYTAAGSPKIGTLEDLLPVFAAMQKAVPVSDTGVKTYPISLFKDWDGNMMCLAKQPACFYGFDELGFVFAKADGSEYQSIVDSDSFYTRVLKFYFNANQMGLVDPESTTQNYDTMFTKYQDGQILYAPWPWLGQAAYNTTENKAAGKGFMLASIDDMKVFSYGCAPAGNRQCISIGAAAEDSERLADFIDWLYSPEGIMMSCAQTMASCGPEGLTWEMKDGQPVLTAFGEEALVNGDATMPAEWGGGSWKDGISQLNYPAVLSLDINPETGFTYNFKLWDSVLAANTTPLDTAWQTAMKAKTTLEYLQNNNQIMVAPGCAFIAPAEDTEIATLRGQCKAIIIEYSWKMVFAADQAEFDSLLKEMQTTVKGLGYDKVLAVDMQNAKDQQTSREESVAAAKG